MDYQNSKLKYILCRAGVFVPLTILLLGCVLPFIMVVSISVTSESSLMMSGYSILPREFNFEAYGLLLRTPGSLLAAYYTTIIVTVVGTAAGVYLMSSLAYVMSRKDFRWRRQLSFFVFFTMLFSGGTVSTYILVTQYLHLKNSLLALILPSLVGAWNIMLLRTFFAQLPVSLIESAKLDGAGEFYIFARIAVPLIKTGIATITLFVCLGFWNEWFNSMLYITDNNKIQLQYMLQKVLNDANFMRQFSQGGKFSSRLLPGDALKMANCVVAAGPAILMFPFFQKYFVKGITMGSIKE